MVSGQITFNGVSDAAMGEIVGAAREHKDILLAPNTQMQVVPSNGPPNTTMINGVTVTWRGSDGLKALGHLLQALSGIA